MVEFLELIGTKTGERPHMLAVCQPAVPAFAATALMGADKNPWRPRTLTMMGGPIDTRKAPTAVNTLATQRPFSWFENNVIATVPMIYPGAGRKVYPGFLQLAGFMTMNLGSHLISHWEMFKHLVEGDDESARPRPRDFYDEYRSVCDMTAEFYLQTVDVVFQQHLLPKGELEHRGRLVDPAAIRDTALLAIEGERDDISGLGQTKAALDIATRLPKAKKQYFMAKDVGHYGIFNGRKWREYIAPVLEKVHRRPRLGRQAAYFIFTLPSRISAATLAAAVTTAAATSAPWNPPRRASPCRASTTPSSAVAIKPPIRDTALLKPDASATCFSSTEPNTDEVSGATRIAMPSAITAIDGSTSVQ